MSLVLTLHDNRVASLDSLDYGIIPGIGFLADRLFNAEAFAYFSRAKTSSQVPSGISEVAPQLDSGLGFKVYHESLDADMFPRSGARAFIKANIAPWDALSDTNYARLTADLDVYAPLAKFLSLRLGFAYGSHFGTYADNSLDLLNYGGAQAFWDTSGLRHLLPITSTEPSAPCLCPCKNCFSKPVSRP